MIYTPASVILNILAYPSQTWFCESPRHQSFRRNCICGWTVSVLSLREENAVAFAPERGEIGKRGICLVGFEFEILRVCRPTHGRRVHDELSVELLLVIVKMDSLLYSAPAYVK